MSRIILREDRPNRFTLLRDSDSEIGILNKWIFIGFYRLENPALRSLFVAL